MEMGEEASCEWCMRPVTPSRFRGYWRVVCGRCPFSVKLTDDEMEDYALKNKPYGKG